MAISKPSGTTATPLRIGYKEFLTRPDVPEHSEWVRGEVVPMAPAGEGQTEAAGFMIEALRLFVRHHGLGRVLQEPFQMRLVASGTSRAPDAMVVLNHHLDRLRTNYLDGPADLVIEIISPDSRRRDSVEKYREYEQAGVPEYWLLDPERREASFFTLVDGAYQPLEPDAASRLESRSIAGLWIEVDWLWERPSGVELLRAWGVIG